VGVWVCSFPVGAAEKQAMSSVAQSDYGPSDDEPLFVASAPLSSDCPPLLGSIPSVVYCSVDEADRSGGSHAAACDAENFDVADDAVGVGHGDSVNDHQDGDDAAAPTPAVNPTSTLPSGAPDRQRFEQSRPGPRHCLGGRKKGSGRRTRENFGVGLRRALGAFLSSTPVESFVSDCGISRATAKETIKLLETWAQTDGKEQVWLVPGVFGVVARWGSGAATLSGSAQVHVCGSRRMGGVGAHVSVQMFIKTTTYTSARQRANTTGHWTLRCKSWPR